MIRRSLVKIAFLVNLLALFSYFAPIESYAQRVTFSSEDSLKSINFLRRQIYDVLKQSGEDKSKYGIAIYSLDRKEYYYKHNIETYFIPASLTKLFTTFGALNKFGEDFKVKTYLYYTGEILNGVLYGNLYIYGTGDPMLSISDIDKLVEGVSKFGIKEIRGNVNADPSFFDSQTDRFVYSGDFDVVQKTQPITSIAIERNILTVIVTAGSIYGKPVSVQVIPASDGIKVYNTAKVSRSLSGRLKNNYDLEPLYGGGDLIAQARTHPQRQSRSEKAFKVTSEVDNDGFQTIIVTGNLPAGATKTYTFFIEKPPIVVAGALKRRLESSGIAVKGTIGIESVNTEKSRLIAVVDRPLVEILREMNKNSDNYLAETVFKMIGAYDKKMTSNSKEAVRYILTSLDSAKIPCLDCKIFDGSGLSRRNRISPESIVHLLAFVANRRPNWHFDSLLSVSGYDGTLKSRMIGTCAEGRVFAKTGTHFNASGLAGYTKTRDNERLVFAFMFNGERVVQFKKIEDELCRILTEFFYSHSTE
ncbi:D-alanyl-D-alanine carboxypeptidase/D-alanyl-D-alanine-endopeptidase [Bacteroidetes/Chlorobi group bacterium MS-B_bin-24]|jgi:D-alanyl-D-alanine carboxypeptidase|nr:MAG: D-alanyl-D-alanine carboxypeptidase/D-alanyl-D-alanine-endopeptidase [Bacteroidetes/Chlorobi group bacterium MS-B_bin-24]